MAGNTFRSDDGVGPYIAQQLAPILDNHPALRLVDAHTNPENHIDELIAFSPALVVFIDAANFGGLPGEFILIEDEAAFAASSASTHTIPLGVIASLIKSECGCAVMYIGIQAENFSLGETLSESVKKAADLFVKAIRTRLSGTQHA
ncbi:MAG: hydrogenase maturation protease [Clostridia bacterium]|nr:hydrogenase maturation protease [Clostridia bacterium]MBT7121680.1 hydrogenase maturation protease [Clostridia bacterium]